MLRKLHPIQTIWRMKNTLLLFPFALLLLLLLAACKDAPSPTEVLDDLMNPKPDTCQLNLGTILNGNRYTDFTAAEKVILRNPARNNWRLEVYDLFDCSMKAVYELPPNESADYPYFLADLNYNNSNRKIGIRGNRSVFLVDLEKQQMSEAIQPQFLMNNRLADAESGSIHHLEVWENYLIGQTVDWGTFVFRLDSITPNSVLPVAELKEDEQYKSLFLIETGKGTYQAILPRFNSDSGLFFVNPLFSEPKAIIPDSTVYAGGPYARVKEQTGKFVGINLRKGELLPVINEKKLKE